MEPFYFKSYDRTIGVAKNVGELQREIVRLAQENPTALQYHLKEGHIVQWLSYSHEEGLASQLIGVESVEEAQNKVTNYLARKSTTVRNESLPSRRAHPRKGR